MDIGNFSVSRPLKLYFYKKHKPLILHDLPDICADSSFLVFIQWLKCKEYEQWEKWKCHEDINVRSPRHSFNLTQHQGWRLKANKRPHTHDKMLHNSINRYGNFFFWDPPNAQKNIYSLFLYSLFIIYPNIALPCLSLIVMMKNFDAVPYFWYI